MLWQMTWTTCTICLNTTHTHFEEFTDIVHFIELHVFIMFVIYEVLRWQADNLS